tara:strand:+ start:2181 stop:2537 length:357 start_codon:yes stop_codon:yes gene_type:complete
MTSTRNKNTKQDYILEKKKMFNREEYLFNENFALSNKTNFPDFGLNMPAMPRDKLAHNSVNIESSLFGIGSSNLEEPQQPVNPEIIQNNFGESIVKRNPLYVPQPLNFNPNERPYFLP